MSVRLCWRILRSVFWAPMSEMKSSLEQIKRTHVEIYGRKVTMQYVRTADSFVRLEAADGALDGTLHTDGSDGGGMCGAAEQRPLTEISLSTIDIHSVFRRI